MNQITRLSNYLKENLEISIDLQPLKNVENVPFILGARYRFYKLHLMGRDFICVEPENGIEITPVEYQKQTVLLRKILGKDIILILNHCTPPMRKRLINYKIPFILPEKQLYLPDLMIDLREHFSTIRQGQSHLTPAAQVMVLYYLQKGLPQPFTPGECVKLLGYTKMTMARAVDELERHGLCRTEKDGKKKPVWFNYKAHELWEKVLPLLRTPVKKVLYIHESSETRHDSLIKAGIEALSEKTKISGDTIPVFATGKKNFNILVKNKLITIAEFREEAGMQLELWSYEPLLLSEDNVVDNVSLYLSMKDTHDERIQSALDEIEREFTWK